MRRSLLERLLRGTALALVVTFFMFPILWIVSASINPLDSLSTNTSIIPEGMTLENYRELFRALRELENER